MLFSTTFLKPFFKDLIKRSVSIVLLFAVAGCLLGARPLHLHDFHASVTQMQFNPKEKAFEISIRLFTDDLETALARESGQKVHLSADEKFDPLIEKYIRAHFAYVTSDRQRKPIDYVGHELETDACWVYIQMPYAEAFQGGQMKQDVLMELFDDQVNMVNIQHSGQKKTFVFRKNQPIQPVSL